MKTRRCYIYTRVSTSMQVDGYSLDAQKDKLKKYAEFQDMVVAGEYSDEGKSGKNIEGRPQFLQMLKDIESGKDKVEFVLVFKLSRFGRNAADVLSSLQRMQDFGVNLICVEDGIDSSKDSGKLMISVLSAVAEIERENILVQTMEGRRQKAREGKWNGGFAPYGYKLVDGYLYIADDEVDVIRIIFDKYVNTTMGASAVATYLNEHGYVKKKRQNNTLDMFSAHFIKSILDNPVYCGKLAYGRRKNEKIAGTRNQYHIVKQDDYPVYDGVHEAIVSEEVWQMAQRKRQETGVKSEKIYNQEHENILSSILRCPVCGAAMYGNVNRKKKKDGTLYKDYYYYHCKHRTTVNGHKCGYRRQWKQEMVDAAVEEVIRKLVTNPKFEQAIRQKIGSRIDTEELETELEQLRKKLHQLNGAKAKLGQQMDSLDVTDKHYDRKYQDMEERLYKLYDDIDSVEEEIEEVETRIYNVRQQKISGDNIYQFLLYFDKLYDKFTDAEKKEFLNSFIERVDIYEQEQPDGRFLKHIKFRFPVYFNGKEIEEMSWDNETTVETCRVVGYNKAIYGKKRLAMEKIKEQIERLLPQMTRIIVSNRLDKTYQYRKVEVTWTTVRGKELCQIAAYTEKQVFQENVDVEELADKLLVHFPEHLCQMNIFTEEKEYSFKMTKKGKLLTNATRLPAKQSGTSKLAKTSGSDVADLADKMNSRRGEHNRKKNYILQEGMTVPPLVDMGIFTKEGKVVRSMYDKYKQINRFVELVDDVLKNETKDEIYILDFGCGKSYLTFVLYYYIVEIRKKKAEIIGLDLKADVIKHCNETAEKYGYDHLHFELGDINGYKTKMPVDMVVTLHACDTATDYALFNAVQWNAKYILSVPCCQHEVNGQIESELLAPMMEYGIIKERMAALATDAIRANMLTYRGYKTQILEFVDFAHSPKNLLIRAVKSAIPKEKRERSLQEVERMCEEMHIVPSIYNLLK